MEEGWKHNSLEKLGNKREGAVYFSECLPCISGWPAAIQIRAEKGGGGEGVIARRGGGKRSQRERRGKGQGPGTEDHAQGLEMNRNQAV